MALPTAAMLKTATATTQGGRALARAFSSVATGAARESLGTALCFTAEERRLRDLARDFAETELLPNTQHMDKVGGMKKEVLNSMFARGLLGIEISKEHGGMGASFTAACLAVEEIAKVDPAVAVLCDIQNTLNNTLVRKLGTEEQKAKYLHRLAKDMVSSFSLSESGSGSDAFGMQSRAVKTATGYVINGSKQWISNSAEAGLFIVMANADPSKGFRGITTFLVERNTPGLHVGKKENKLGIRASSTCSLTFEDMMVDDSQVLGQPGQGYKYAIGMLNEGRIGIAAQMLGLALGALHYSRPFFTEHALSKGNAAAMNRVQGYVEAARLMVYNAARLREAGQPFIKEAAMAKLYASQVAEQTSRACVEWCGPVGVTAVCPAERYYRDSKIGAIYEGTSNILRNTIAKQLDPAYK